MTAPGRQCLCPARSWRTGATISSGLSVTKAITTWMTTGTGTAPARSVLHQDPQVREDSTTATTMAIRKNNHLGWDEILVMTGHPTRPLQITELYEHPLVVPQLPQT
jgi:hypothetical protein